MTQPKDNVEDALLEAAITQARQQQPPVPSELKARVLADAQRWQPAAKASPDASALMRFKLPNRFRFFGAAGGVLAASCVGFVIGFNPPPFLSDVTSMVFGSIVTTPIENEAEISGFGWDLGEI